MSFLTTFNLSLLGAAHTAIGLVAIGAGVVAFARHGAIGTTTSAGRLFLWTTLITVLTGFGIFRHGGFGNPHVLGVVTLVVLGLAFAAERTKLFGLIAPYVATVAFSLSFFFHFIPGTVETLTRLPLGAPLASGPDAPIVQQIVGMFFAVFLAGATWQVIRLRGTNAPTAPPLNRA